MSNQFIFEYPLDVTGNAESNLVTVPITLGGGTINRSFAHPLGPFYAEGLRIATTSNPSNPLVRGTDFELLFYNPKLSKMAKNKEICHAIIITNGNVSTDITATAQIVGGPFGVNVSAIEQAIALLDLDNRKLTFAEIKEIPDVFTAAPSYKDIGDIFGFEYLIGMLTVVNASILRSGKIDNDALTELLNIRDEALTAALDEFKAAEGNVHNAKPADFGTYDKGEIDKLLEEQTKVIENLQSTINDLTDNGDDLNNDNQSNALALKALNDLMGILNNNYQKVVLMIAKMSDRLSEYETKLTNDSLRIDDLEKKCKDLQTQINNISIRLDSGDIRVELNGIKQSIIDLGDSTAGVQENLDAHINSDNDHPNYLHKVYGGVVINDVHVNNILSSKTDVQVKDEISPDAVTRVAELMAKNKG